MGIDVEAEVQARVEARKKAEDGDDVVLLVLSQRLREHDWTYQYSDDHRYWRAGEASWKRILELLRRARSEGKTEEARALWVEHCPKNQNGTLFIQFPNI